ncbi:hypothetical protein GFD17_02700 [Bifidobacterium sp. SMB2]|uniref:Uncharacterized protein n=1 Tax=Bifidobacterium saimiriisciurei TaxID=2661627 RepID=A0ABX0CA34_9BIFI|nr:MULTISPECIES: hypothetical protein [Bifidobacterium]NEG95679.1 hypothetical protein [Bifidobacterium sp. SMB2]NEH11106.1 hypothetical protein [Bifidobacterium saimiriisciurei]
MSKNESDMLMRGGLLRKSQDGWALTPRGERMVLSNAGDTLAAALERDHLIREIGHVLDGFGRTRQLEAPMHNRALVKDMARAERLMRQARDVLMDVPLRRDTNGNDITAAEIRFLSDSRR